MTEKEINRLQALISFDREFGQAPLLGIDEVGRGCLAGPVVAGCVCMPDGVLIEGVKDSKKLSEKQREKIAAEIREKAVFWAVGSASVEEIEALNIVAATKLAMQRAFMHWQGADPFVLIDAIDPAFLPARGCGVVKADAQSYAVAAASIVAKVYRDGLMCEMAKQWPAYQFENNKGYGTAAHCRALKDVGPCPAHRPSFIGGILHGRP
ncbi:MAG: ribonuclease HII [Clostridia bacterium]|nr:ribonuclease HII [Clostridia bacterium]